VVSVPPTVVSAPPDVVSGDPPVVVVAVSPPQAARVKAITVIVNIQRRIRICIGFRICSSVFVVGRCAAVLDRLY
jgi:hypothetical protein